MRFILTFLIPLLIACNDNDDNTNDSTLINDNSNKLIEIVSVAASENGNNYTFSVGISSPDTGCEQYANWWEVITEDGALIYRRILGHSHVNEQPFVRSGGSVNILENQVVIIRAHMNNSGYGIKAFKGSISSGFTAITIENDFALDLAEAEPQPTGCAF